MDTDMDTGVDTDTEIDVDMDTDMDTDMNNFNRHLLKKPRPLKVTRFSKSKKIILPLQPTVDKYMEIAMSLDSERIFPYLIRRTTFNAVFALLTDNF
jgi:hypothetical protein